MTKALLIFLLTLPLCAANASPPPLPLTVAIDPGHGGSDQGAVYGKAKESSIALLVARSLQKILDEDPQFKTILTRHDNSSLSLQERVDKAEKAKAQIFLSIHTNASPDRRARGFEIYLQNQLPAEEDNLVLATLENQNWKAETESAIATQSKQGDVQAILADLRRQNKMTQSHQLSQKLVAAWGDLSRYGHKESSIIRQAPFYVISKTQIPSVLVELGFLSNRNEADLLMNQSNQKEIAKRLYRGLLSYKEMIDRTHLGRLQ